MRAVALLCAFVLYSPPPQLFFSRRALPAMLSTTPPGPSCYHIPNHILVLSDFHVVLVTLVIYMTHC